MPKKPAGRPTKYDKSKLEMIKKILEVTGATDKQLAQILDVTEQTINNWKHKFPQFFESLKEAKAVADKRVEDALYKCATGYRENSERLTKDGDVVSVEEYYSPNTTAQIFWLKNRQPTKWRDKQELEHSGNVQVNLIIGQKGASADE